ncbi:single-stranded DNA-binding [Babesia ovis]|uniref:Single-stranded DNA-binding n=1 Tax=Babesia ovis TaxID=5869 RepID=A0A9W5WVY9_BABOV|nr:single-stranded DNA-binding [Babesia ovis]
MTYLSSLHLYIICVALALSPSLCLRTRSYQIHPGYIVTPHPSTGFAHSFGVNSDPYGAAGVEDVENPIDDVPSYLMDDVSRNSEPTSPSVNTVTLCGHIGYIDQPVTIANGYKALRLAVATNERGRMGATKTQWHKVVIYGQGNVDYVHSKARVGDRALVIGSLSYYSPPSQDGSTYKAKIAEVSVRLRGAGHSIILMPRAKYQDDDYPLTGMDDEAYNFGSA